MLFEESLVTGLKNKTLLYVEDDPDIREEMVSILTKKVKTLHVAINGKEGLELYTQYKPDIVVTDIQMPVMNGLDMAAGILEINSYVPIIVISAFSDSDYLFEAIKLGIKDYLTKPVKVNKLGKSLETISEQLDLINRLKISALVYDNTQEAIMVTDAYATILDINAGYTTITGYQKEEVVGKNCSILQSGHHDINFYKNMWEQLLTEGRWQGNIWNRKKNGRIYPEWLNIAAIRDNHGEITNFIAIFSDITLLKEHEKKLEYLAHNDMLTGLPNRVLLNIRLKHTLETCQRLGTYAAICFLDLDNFKIINDTHGHDMGDEVLKEASMRLQKHLRATDTLARIGGDEFVFVFENLHHPDEMTPIAERIISSINEPFLIEGNTFLLGGSIGIAIFPDDGDSCVSLTKNADIAMYAAKNGGKNTFRYYNPQMTSDIVEQQR